LSRIDTSFTLAGVRWPLVYLGVALTTLASLILELALTRIYSVIFYYHMAFLAISGALFGLGLGGVLSYVVASRSGVVFRKLGWISLLNSFAVVGALAFLLSRGPEIGNTTLAGVYVVCAIPFALAGIVVSLAISETIERVDRVYFFDLLGAAGGCLLLIPFLNYLGGPNTVIAAAVLFASSSAIWFTVSSSSKGRIAAVAGALALCALVGYNAKTRLIDVRNAKGAELRTEIYRAWNSISRIGLGKEPSSGIPLIVIDADASTAVANFNFDRLPDGDRRNLLGQGPGLPYALRPGAKTLIIGPGGGYDVARALASGSKDITGVEINPIIANTIMRVRFGWMSRNLYKRPEVHIHVEDGRSFVRRSRESYQVLQATLVDTWASTAAGAFALTENTLYTSDAFYDYLAHLTSDGIMAFTRWGFPQPRESLRLLTLASHALEKIGEREAWRHVLVAREAQDTLTTFGALDTVIVSRKPLSARDIEQARNLILESGMRVVYLPGDTDASNPFAQVLRSTNLRAYLASYPYDVSAIDDNRPFFFYTVQPRDVWSFFRSSDSGIDYKINRAVPLLFGLVGISLLATAITLALPPLVLRSRLPAEPGIRKFLVYFICIGVGYILIQVALIQRFVLFLGHPTYALSVIIFSMLVSSGLGSYYSRRMGTAKDATLRRVLITVAVLVAILAFLAPAVASIGVGWPLPMRMLVSVALIAPAGFVMGMPFPSGLERLERRHKPSVRWAWSLNAASSVLGSALAIFLALYLGLRETLLIGGALYLAAIGTIRYSSRVPSSGKYV